MVGKGREGKRNWLLADVGNEWKSFLFPQANIKQSQSERVASLLQPSSLHCLLAQMNLFGLIIVINLLLKMSLALIFFKTRNV